MEQVKVEKDEDVIINLILEHGCKNIAEIGVWQGWMTKRILNSPAHKVIENYWAMDNWDQLKHKDWRDWTKITDEEWEKKYFTVCKLMRYFPNLHVVRAPSLKAANLFWKGYFDLVYIDACHWYEDVIDDIKAWLPLVKPGGIIAGHDYGPVRDGKGRRSRNEVKTAVDYYFGVNNVNNINVGANEVWFKKV